ncbi:MAG: hypothetical protein ACI35W_01495 [Anaeroplasmataceae bacterium]
MGVYYNFCLEKKIEDDKWISLEYEGDNTFYYVRSHARFFIEEYGSSFPIGFNHMNEEFKKKNMEQYNNANELEKGLMCSYYWMDLDRIIEDYSAGIHEYAGIISKNDLKKLKSYSDYNPKIIDEEIYAKFEDDIKKNYIYYEWDTYYGEYYYLYKIVPIIEQMLKIYNLNICDVRLLCRIG